MQKQNKDDRSRGNDHGDRKDLNHNGSGSSDSSRNSTNSGRSKSSNPIDHIVKKHNKTRQQSTSYESNNSTYENTATSAEQRPSLTEIPGTNLGLDSCVIIKATGLKGVIKWIGILENRELLVGLETMVDGDKIEPDTTGNWDIHRGLNQPFQVENGKFAYVDPTAIVLDPIFNDSVSLYHSTNEFEEQPTLADFPPFPLQPALPARAITTTDDLRKLCGKFRGIQGHHNSCYLDATVFSMFAFTNIMDSVLLNKKFTKEDFPTYDFQRILRDEIVNPLRYHGYVPWGQVMKLRLILDKIGSGYTKEEKDPEEFLNMMFVNIFKAEPLLKLNSNQGSFFYQLFVEKDERLTFPTVQQLFDQSFSSSDVKLTEIPSCLIIQMPRFGNKYKMYPHILPSHVLDITDILEDSPRQCTLCGKLAEQECVDCFNTANEVSLETSTFCEDCFTVYHKHAKRMSHTRIKKINNSKSESIETFKNMRCNVERIFMELFAVVCIETSHYVSFVKTGQGQNAPWCFFDSMADRKGGANGYNIPELVVEEEITQFLSEESTNFQKLTKQAKRLLGDAYMCMYQSEELRKYK